MWRIREKLERSTREISSSWECMAALIISGEDILGAGIHERYILGGNEYYAAKWKYECIFWWLHALTDHIERFVDEYDTVLRRMVENETRADFDSFNRTIPCISALQLEKQFQVVYTNAKFIEVPWEVCENYVL
jgi:hypothetical protein